LSKEKVIVALDVDTPEKAVGLVVQLKDSVGAFKVGLELVNSADSAYSPVSRKPAQKEFSTTANSTIFPTPLRGPLALRASWECG